MTTDERSGCLVGLGCCLLSAVVAVLVFVGLCKFIVWVSTF